MLFKQLLARSSIATRSSLTTSTATSARSFSSSTVGASNVSLGPFLSSKQVTSTAYRTVRFQSSRIHCFDYRSNSVGDTLQRRSQAENEETSRKSFACDGVSYINCLQDIVRTDSVTTIYTQPASIRYTPLNSFITSTLIVICRTMVACGNGPRRYSLHVA
ncbi:hypothetical protein P389DRAFT_64980 [Cystobasidium minutum MCA 4210]|uniref:uncharacterized protein n=1 Tax=Cystobasidium minutum MCA 4210 TaxID=1397322 RepID=UPI0034CF07C7|eukprot:jgi/Rhomi1/64980/CE64979_20068